MSINERLALTTSENKTVLLTSKIKYLYSNDSVTMCMSWQGLSSNMQNNGAAFEGCAAAIKAWYSDPGWNGTVCLDIQMALRFPLIQCAFVVQMAHITAVFCTGHCGFPSNMTGLSYLIPSRQL